MRKIKLREGTNTAALFGHHDRHLKLIEEEFGVRCSARGEEVTVEGTPETVKQAERVLNELASLTNEGYDLRSDDVTHALTALRHNHDASLKELLFSASPIVTRKRFIVPKTPTQKYYLDAIEKHDIVIGIGPAGTGKTYLAMAMAVSALMKKDVSRIILARPAVEAGEKLGYLPGDMYAKVNPYLRPLYDALFDMMDMERANRLIERGDIEIAPLAFMRGRTLNDSFVILDEAQNATAEQMKMFLTRLGFHSKAVVTGDITQIDLPSDRVSGLIEVRDIRPVLRLRLSHGKARLRRRAIVRILSPPVPRLLPQVPGASLINAGCDRHAADKVAPPSRCPQKPRHADTGSSWRSRGTAEP